MANALQLRKLADWHRCYAETGGNDAERDSRKRFAEYLDRLAGEARDREKIAAMRKDPSRIRH